MTQAGGSLVYNYDVIHASQFKYCCRATRTQLQTRLKDKTGGSNSAKVTKAKKTAR